MKIRAGFVSNSSSTSFVLDTTNMPKDLMEKIRKMTSYTYDSSRCTGVIWDIVEWAAQFDDDEYAWLAIDYGNKSNIMVRESDEAMGGLFSDYKFGIKDIKPFVLLEFEYH